ncbi:MAG: hypothetical protein IT426_03290 [Pirellulales bacterium]|nr:hypothetical protein [Pirellulales bacterium]
MLLAGSGCSFVKVPQGWILDTGWSLEFHRMPFNVSREKPRETTCETGCNPTCNADCANPSHESGTPTVAPAPIEPAPCLHIIEEGALPQAGESSGLMNLLKRRGRLGVCATCGKLGRFKEPRPAEPATMPMIAKFHPVPAAPVFCPHPNTIAANPAEFHLPAGNKQPAAPNGKIPLPPQPGRILPPMPQMEIIPPPPPSVGFDKLEREPRELDVPPEPPDWIFSAPENRPDKVIEAQSQPNKSRAPATRR